MKRAPVLRLWMNSRVGKSRGRSVISRSLACPAIMPSMPMARARSRASPERTTASGPPGQPWPRISKARFWRPKAARIAVASPWATWQVGRPRRVCASSIEGRSSRMRLAVCTISMAQAAGSTLSGSPRRISATSRARMGRSRLPGAKRLLRRAASTRGACPATTRVSSVASTCSRRCCSVASRVLQSEAVRRIAAFGRQRASSAFSTCSAWPSTRTRGKTLRTTPWASITKVERIMPMNFLP